MRHTWSWVALLALLGATPLAAQNGTIVGRVLDRASNQPLAGAQVFVAGTSLGALANEDGQYLIREVPAGEQEVRVTLIGYGPATKTVTVTGGGTARADFALETSAIALEGLVVSATGVEQRSREVGNSVANVRIEDVPLSTVKSVPDLLQGRATGVSVLQSSGTTGTASRIRIRGNNSISLSNEPLVIVDGVRVTSDNNAADIVAGQSTSRFNDFNAEEIESIEVLKGPAAAALYGTAAANGVIAIKTRRGRAGTTRFRAYTEQGTTVEDNEYPANYRRRGVTVVPLEGVPVGTPVNCFITTQAAGICDPTETLSFNPLEENSPFQDGSLAVYGVSMSGGQDQVQFFVSAETKDEEGIYEINTLDQVNLRANLDAELRDDLTLAVKTGYVSSDARLPYNDNAVEGIVSSGLLGSYQDGSTGGYYYYPLENRFAFENEQGVERFIGSVSAHYTPLSWLAVNGMAGLDLLTTTTLQTLPPNVFSPSIDRDYSIGYRFATRDVTRGLNSNLSATATFDLTPELVSTTIVGGQYIEDRLNSVGAGGYGLLPGTRTLEALSEQFDLDETTLKTVTVGAYVSEQLAWRDRLFLTAALRGDDNSAFGNDFGLALYPSVSGSWVVAEEEWFPVDFLSTLRLRAAYGQSGLQPGFRTARQFFNPVTATIRGDISVPAVTIGGAGNPDLKPERSSEYELGFDAGLLSDRLGLEVTYYNKESTDALVNRPLPPSLGSAGRQTINIGGVRNQGLETLLNMQLLQRENVRWNATVSYALNDNEVLELGQDVTGEPLPPIIFGLGTNTQRIQEGYELGAYFAPTLDYEDANGDGIIAPSELIIGDEAVHHGSPFPTREASFGTTLSLFDVVELNALVDYKGGHKLYNATEEFRCSVFASCRAMNDASASLADQAAAVAAYQGYTVAGFFEDADYAKLRSVALTFRAPQEYAERIGAGDLSLTLSGRNLYTWTDYRGLDPEINSAGSANFSTYDFLGQPPVKNYTLRVDLTF